MPVASSAETYNPRVIAPAPLRLPVRVARLGLHLAWGVALAAALFPLLAEPARQRVVVAWSRRLLKVLGVRLAAGPAPAARGALLVCNHVSWLDVYAILATRHVHFVSKSEVRDWPVVGWLSAKAGTLFLQRGRRADTARVNQAMHALMQTGEWVAVFPEGTTTDGRGLKRFLPSLLQPAVSLACPVLPAALRYRSLEGEPSTAAAYIDKLSLWQSLKRIASQPGLIVELDFAAPLAPSGHRRELARDAEQAVAGLLGVTPEARDAA